MTPSSPPARGPHRLFFWLAIVLAVVIAGSALAEIVLRLTLPQARAPLYRQYPGYYTYPPHQRLEMENEPGETIPFITDARGLRNPPDRMDEARLILLGDSTIASVNARRAETLAARLDRAGWPTYNAGVDGTGTLAQLHLLERHLGGTPPRWVVLGFSLASDFMENYWADPGEPEAAAERGDASSDREGLGLGGGWIFAIKNQCPRSRLCTWLRTHLYAGLIRRQGIDPMGSYPLGQIISWRHNDPRVERMRDRTRAILALLRQVAQAQGRRLVVMGIPSRAQTRRSFAEISSIETEPRTRAFALETIRGGYSFDQPDRMLGEICQELSLPYLSLLPAFRARNDQPLFYQIDAHWTPLGQQAAAENLVPFLNRLVQEGEGG